jgi:hypothetical protein
MINQRRKPKKRLGIFSDRMTHLHNCIGTILFPPLDHVGPHLLCLLNVKFPCFQESTKKNQIIEILNLIQGEHVICKISGVNLQRYPLYKSQNVVIETNLHR